MADIGRVVVIDPESPWAGREGDIIDQHVDMIVVRFQTEYGKHDRCMARRQIAAA